VSSRAAWCVLLTGFAAAASNSCREISVCRDTELCAQASSLGGAPTGGGTPSLPVAGMAPSGTGSGSGGRDGEAGGVLSVSGAAGVAGGSTCQPPIVSCDDTELNGCETDISGDAYHCGACNAVCEGVCARSACHLPVALGAQPISPISQLCVTPDYVYFMSGGPDGPYRLSRAERASGTVELVRDGLPMYTSLGFAENRVFLWGDGEPLRSVGAQGDWRDEELTVSALAAPYGAIYVVSEGALFQRKKGASQWQPKTWFQMDSGKSELRPLAAGGDLVVFRVVGDDATAEYQLFAVDTPDSEEGGLRVLTQGPGELVRVRAAGEYVYWLVRVGDAPRYELRRKSVYPDTPVHLLASERDAKDFALDEAFAYLIRRLSFGSELEAMPLESVAEKYHWGARFELLHPESVDESIWYFNTSKRRLLRVNLGLDELL